MATRRAALIHDGTPILFDHGAQYFTARSDVFQKQVQQWLSDHVLVKEWTEPIVSLENDLTIDHKSGDSPLGSLATTTEKGTIKRYIASTGGMNSICKGLRKEVEGRATFVLNSRVTALKRENDKWHIVLENATTYQQAFDMVVLSCPPEQSLQLLKDSHIESPLMSDINVEMSPCWALLISFPTPLSQSVIKGGGAFVNLKNSSIGWVSNQRLRQSEENQQSDVWVIHASKEWSRKNLELTPEQAKDILYNDFIEVLTKFDSTFSNNGLKPTYCEAHRWRYSIPTNPAANHRVILDRDLQLACIGDWVEAGRVEGAYMSGYNLANTLSKL